MYDKLLIEFRNAAPYKAILPGHATERFQRKEEALEFYHAHQGTCLLSKCNSEGNKIIAYKNPKFK